MFVQHSKELILLLVVFLVSMWAVNNEPEQDLFAGQVKVEHSADHFAVNYSKIAMNESGLPENKLYADYAAHYSDNNETELTRPVFTVNKTDQPPWVIRSQTGIVTDDGQTLFMRGQVYIDRAGTEEMREVNIKTSNLHVQPKKNYAETGEWAELVSGLDTISGVGMKVYYQDPLYIELLASVKGTHVYE